MRAFHHGAIVYNTNAGVHTPKDLEGKKVGVRAYSVTTGVWTRGIFVNEYGLDSAKVAWAGFPSNDSPAASSKNLASPSHAPAGE